MLTKAEARKITLGIAGTTEKPYFGKPAIFHGEDFIARVHDGEPAVALRVGGLEMRDMMLEAEPGLFYITDHYKSWPMLLVRLAALDRKTLQDLLGARILQVAAKSAAKGKGARKKRKVKKPAAKKTAKKKSPRKG